MPPEVLLCPDKREPGENKESLAVGGYGPKARARPREGQSRGGAADPLPNISAAPRAYHSPGPQPLFSS